MSEETRLAFAHPEDRAAAMAGADPLDRISLRDHLVEVEIGAFQAERDVTQRVAFNVVVEVLPLSGDADDDVDRILSYDRITEAIAAELAAERLNLLETLAERIADRILREPQAARVFLRIEKLDRGPGALGVEIVRTPASGDTEPAAEGLQPHPLVVWLSHDAQNSDHLKGWVDQLAARGLPLIFCVAASRPGVPAVAEPQAQRRIDLLAMEQAAWVLSARAPRCVVVATRTELDWAMKNGQISVWAPSRIVLDAVGGPGHAGDDGLELAQWLATEIGAESMIAIGGTLPSDLPFPAQSLPVDRAKL